MDLRSMKAAMPRAACRSLALAATTLFAALSLIGVAGAGHDSDGVDLVPGGNLVAYEGVTLPVVDALADAGPAITSVWSFDSAAQEWSAWSTLLPPSLQSLDALEHGRPYFVFASVAGRWTFPTGAPSPSCIDEILPRALDDLGEAEFFTIDEVVLDTLPDLDADDVSETIAQVFFAQNRRIAIYLSGDGCRSFAGTVLALAVDVLPTVHHGVRDIETDATCGLAGLCRTFTTYEYDGARYQEIARVDCMGEPTDPARCPVHTIEP